MVLKSFGRQNIFDSLEKSCCSMETCQRRDLEVDHVLQLRKEYWLKGVAKTQYLVEKLQSMWKKGREMEYLLLGRVLCQAAFCRVIGCSTAKVQRIIRELKDKDGHVAVKVLICGFLALLKLQVHGNKGKGKKCSKKEKIQAVVSNYINVVCDVQPDSEELHMPVCLNGKQLFRCFIVCSVI
jgi:hypothetical protein